MTQIVTPGAHGHLAVQLVTVVPLLDIEFAQRLPKVSVSRQTVKLVERKHVRRIPVRRALVRLANGLNGDNALKHVVEELKIGFECCVVQIAIPKNN